MDVMKGEKSPRRRGGRPEIIATAALSIKRLSCSSRGKGGAFNGNGLMSDVTMLLDAIQSGDPGAPAQLLPLVYKELRQLAKQRLAHEAPGQTLDPTALVHEAYLRLVGEGRGQHWDGRAHFLAAAAQAMRRILVENARRKHSLKHGGGMARSELEEVELLAPEPREELLALDAALTKLAATKPAAADLVQLRYFGDLSIPEAARVLHISPRTANRLWTYARAWLHREIAGNGPDKERS